MRTSPEGWKSVVVGDLICHAIGGGWGGDDASPGTTRVRVIRGADFPQIESGQYEELPTRFEEDKKVSRRVLEVGDVVLEISGGTKDRPTGRTVFVTAGLLESHADPIIPASFCRLIRPDPEKVYPHFLYYALREFYRSGRAWEYQNQSTGLSNFQFEYFKGSYVLAVPPRGEQLAIAEVLGALDDKIAANRKLAATADRLAQSCFRGLAARRSVEFDSSTLTYDDVAVVGGGGTPKTGISEYWDGDIPWATPTDVTALDVPSLGSTARTITEEGLTNSSAKLYPTGSILMTSRATIGAFAIAENPIAVNQGFIAVNAKDPECQWWLFHDMRTRVDEFISHANGATFLEIPRGRFKALPVAIPNRDVVAAFSVKASGLHQVAVSAAIESRRLVALRDTLLPRLMSGELRVRDAEKSVEDVL